MSDKELIIRLLEAAERRIRRNRVLNDTAAGLAFALLIPLAFKLIDLIFPFRGTTVVLFFVVWGAATAAWLVWRNRGRDALERAAASIDQKIGAHDEIKTAYWFIRNPKSSPWVETQLQRAAQNTAHIKVESLYPSRIPRATYTAVALIFLLGILNFLPLPWNNNWLNLEGAPAFSLTDAQKAMLEQAMELLREAEALEEGELAERLAEIIRALQDGSMSQNELSRSLAEMQRAVAEKKLDVGRIADGLQRIAKALEPSVPTRPIATELFGLDLKNAAAEVRELAKDLKRSPESALQEMAARFQEASEVAGRGLEQLAQNIQSTANSMRQRNISGGEQGLEQVAGEL
jgi:hypothetical protein